MAGLRKRKPGNKNRKFKRKDSFFHISDFQCTGKVLGWTTSVQLPASATMGFLFFTTASRQALGPTQHSIQ
jgi:hypothetical protein